MVRLFAHVARAHAARALCRLAWVAAVVLLVAKGPAPAAVAAVVALAFRLGDPGPDADLDRLTGRGGQ